MPTMIILTSAILLLTFSNLSYCLCRHGYFSFNGSHCHPWLMCSDIQELTLGELIGFGAVKKVYLSSWKDMPIAVVFVNNPQYIADFHHGLNLLINLNPNKYVVVLMGHCKESNVYITKYYPRGSLLHFNDHLPRDHNLNFQIRFKLCLNYIEIINFIHSAFDTPAVMCDSNTLNKTLEQYLLTDDNSLVLNDIDALTVVKNGGLVCGHKEISGNFVAPEQLWPNAGNYDEKLMTHYNEKTDIWKIPSVCQHILGLSNQARAVRYNLFEINKACRQIDPMLRPDASTIFLRYVEVYDNIFRINDEL